MRRGVVKLMWTRSSSRQTSIDKDFRVALLNSIDSNSFSIGISEQVPGM